MYQSPVWNQNSETPGNSLVYYNSKWFFCFNLVNAIRTYHIIDDDDVPLGEGDRAIGLRSDLSDLLNLLLSTKEYVLMFYNRIMNHETHLRHQITSVVSKCNGMIKQLVREGLHTLNDVKTPPYPHD